MVASSVKMLADELGIPVLQPARLGADVRKLVGDLEPDLMVVAAYSKIFGPKFLSLFRYGAINMHPSLLPRHRGPSPIPAAILAGDENTGVTVQCVDAEMDAGDILLQKVVEIRAKESTGELSERLGPIGAEMLSEVVALIERGDETPVAQDHSKATYCKLILKDDGHIRWSMRGVDIERQVRAFNPWPVAFTHWKGSRLSILKANGTLDGESDYACTSADIVPGKVFGVDKALGILVQTNHGILAVEELQLQSRKALGWKAFINGTPDFLGSILGGD